MDQALKDALSWSVLLFCFGILVITAIVKRVVTAVLARNPQPSVEYYWKKVVLPVLPLIVGGLASWGMVKYPYPAIVQSHGIRVFFGFSCGLFSGFLYSIAKSVLAAKGSTSVDPLADEPTSPPPQDK
jgi:hypothetical protein